MSKRKLDYLSDHLKAIRNKFADFRHCGILFDHMQVEFLVDHFDQFIEMARDLENEISRREWNDRAHRDPSLHADEMALGGNVVAFPGRTPDHRPTGGSAA